MDYKKITLYFNSDNPLEMQTYDLLESFGSGKKGIIIAAVGKMFGDSPPTHTSHIITNGTVIKNKKQPKQSNKSAGTDLLNNPHSKIEPTKSLADNQQIIQNHDNPNLIIPQNHVAPSSLRREKLTESILQQIDTIGIDIMQLSDTQFNDFVIDTVEMECPVQATFERLTRFN